MSEDQKKQLEQQLWNIANTLRGKMDADEFRDYILGFIFYKYLSEKMHTYADSMLEEDGVTYQSVDEKTAEGKQYLEAIKEESLVKLGYFLKPSELFSAVARRGNGNGKAENGEKENPFILEDLATILNNIEQSTMGTDSEDDFDNLFEDLDLTSTKLGKTVSARNELISKVLAHLDKIDFQIENAEADILGDAYEYLIAQFASGAGKKAGEFYTPQEVSKILSKLVTVGKKKLKSVYDPTCGSGSLLLRVAKEIKEVGKFYGQELNRTTYNLARMNMILHGIHYQKFDLRQEDSLEHPQHVDERFEAIVANPPFSAKWSASPLHLGDDRFSQYGLLAPRARADFAFIQHMIHHLADNGSLAVVVPHGVLYREGSEGHIRQYLIKDRNYLDAVIGLPENIFYGTNYTTCILVFKKCRENADNILFINSRLGFGKRGNQNYLRDSDINRIIETYVERAAHSKFSHVANLDEIASNDYNLNITRYVDTFDDDIPIQLKDVSETLTKVDDLAKDCERIIGACCEELGIPAPSGNNIPLLSEFKKGVMQKLFAREVRFKDRNGRDFGDWDEKPLGKIGKFTKGKGISKDDVSESGKLECIRYGELYTHYGETIDEVISRTDTPASELVLSEPNDVIIPSSGETNLDIAKASCVLRNGIALGGDLNIIRTKINGVFLSYYLNNRRRLDIARLAQGSSVVHLYPKHLARISVDVPAIDEQNRIGDFLSAIDRKINLISQLPR